MSGLRRGQPANSKSSRSAKPSAKPDDKSKKSASANSSSKQVRKCQLLFVLGAGVDPAPIAVDLSAEFRAAAGKSFDFSAAKPVVKSCKPWKQHDKLGFKLSVTTFISDWFDEHDMPFDEERIVLRDFSDDAGKLYAVAGYFPRTKEARRAVPDDPSQDSAADNDADDDDDVEAFADESQDESPSTPEDEVVFGKAPGGAKLYLQKAVEFVKAQPKSRLIKIGVGSAIILVLLAVLPVAISTVQEMLASRPVEPVNSEGEGEEVPGDKGSNKRPKKEDNARQAVTPKFTPASIAVYTPEPGFHVLLDGEPVLNEDGDYVETPCSVTCEQGKHEITVFRDGWIDQTKPVNVARNSEADFEPDKDDKMIGSEVLTAPYLEAKIGEVIPLKGINTHQSEIDPFVTKDRLTIYFVGDRKEGRGVFMATRPTPFHDFESPKILYRTPDMPATPSVTDDGLQLLVTVPLKGRLILMKRPRPTGDFGDRMTLKQSDKESVLWPSSQIMGDGLRVYWTEVEDAEFKTYSMSRKTPTADFDKTLKVRLPGEHACVSSDGLRQYDFDGQKLTRYRRPNLNSKFPEDGEVIGEIDLADIEYSADYRQYFVTSDEQWLFYCDKPDDGGDIKMVRLSIGPQWGLKPTGKGISPKPKQLAKNDPMNPDGGTDPEGMTPEEKPKPKPPKPVDPRTIPLPYAVHQKAFVALLSERKYDEAQDLLDGNWSKTEFDPFKTQLEWDRTELKAIRQFWADIEKSAKEMPVGETFRIGTNQVKFTEFKDGIVVAKLGTAEMKRPLFEMVPADLSSFFDRLHKGPEPEPQWRFAVFLAYDKQAVERQFKTRSDKAGALGSEFLDHRARRKLDLAKAEFARKNYGNGTAFIAEAEPLAPPASPILKELAEMRAMLFSLVKWEPRGKREWIIEDGTYRASNQRFENSMLLSSEQFENFEITFEWQVEATVQAQGGIYFRYPGSGDIYEKSYKIHLANDAGVKPDVYSSGALFAISAADLNPVKPAGEWNTTTIRVVGSTVTVTINDKRANRANLGSSKVPDKGYVGLDGGIGGITYRKVRLTELPAE